MTTRLSIYGGIGIPYGSFSGKTISTGTTVPKHRGFTINVGRMLRAS